MMSLRLTEGFEDDDVQHGGKRRSFMCSCSKQKGATLTSTTCHILTSAHKLTRGPVTEPVSMNEAWQLSGMIANDATSSPLPSEETFDNESMM